MERENGMIAIKGMKMPKHCMTCEFHDQMYNRCNIGHFETGAKFIKGDAKWYFKHPNCPLVEIVTCKDCKHFERLTCLGGQCVCPTNTYINETTNDFYCKNGERRK